MISLTKQVLDTYITPFNKDVIEGLATPMLRDAPEYIDKILSDAILQVKQLGVEYHGWRKLSPMEHYQSLFNAKNAPIVFDISKSTLYKIELSFSVNGKPFKKYLLLPFTKYGKMLISDTQYYITPVLTDTVISPNDKEVFVRLLKDKLTFSRLSRNILINGKTSNNSLIYCMMIRTAKRRLDNSYGDVVPPISLYLPAVYGIHGCFRKYFNTEVVVTVDKIDYKDYPNHTVYAPIGVPLKGYKLGAYLPSRIKFIVPNDKRTSAMDTFMTGLLYAFDIFPDKDVELIEELENKSARVKDAIKRVQNELKEDPTNIKLKDALNKLIHKLHSDEKDFWKLLTGMMIFKNTYTVTSMANDMEDHFKIIESYIDTTIREKLSEMDVVVNDYFDFLHVVTVNFNDWIVHSKEMSSNIYNRYYDVKYYILFDIISGINTTVSELNRRASKSNRPLSNDEILKIFSTNLSHRRIYKILKDGGNLALNLVDSSGDNMYTKVSSMAEDQARGRGVLKSTQSAFPFATRFIRGPHLYIGNFLYLAKKNPSGVFRLGPNANICISTGRILPSDNMRRITDLLDRKLAGKTADTEAADSEIAATIEDI